MKTSDLATEPTPKLMIPGPVDVDESVLEAMSRRVPAHYGPEWTALYRETTDHLKRVFQTDGDVLLLVSSGSGGLDAAICSVLGPGDKAIVVVNGFFGARLAEIAQSRGVEAVLVTAPWGRAVDVDEVRSTLSKTAGATALLVVHHETSTGIVNPIKEIGEVAHQFGAFFIVDAVSSLAGEPLAMDEWGIDVCVAASQKCLEAPPGLAPVAVGLRGWQTMDTNQRYPAGWYLNLRTWRRYAEEWADWHPYPITMATPTVLALRAALACLETEGLEGRMKRYRAASEVIRGGLRNLGLRLSGDLERCSSTITVVDRPSGVEVSDMIRYLKREWGIWIAGGLGETAGQIFRVGHMGRASSECYVDCFLSAMADYLENRPQ